MSNKIIPDWWSSRSSWLSGWRTCSPKFFPDSIIYKEKSSSWMILTHVDRQLSTACYMPACSFSHFVKVFCHSISFNRWDSTITYCGTSVTSHRSKDALKTLLLWNRTKYVHVFDYVSLLQDTLLKDFFSQLLHMWFAHINFSAQTFTLRFHNWQMCKMYAE